MVTAAGVTEFAYERGNLVAPVSLPSSLFTRALIDGIRTGAADLDQDGPIDLDELYVFVERRVVAAHPDQHPNRWHSGSRGKIYVTHSTRRRIRPGTLPEHIRDLLDHGAAGVRLAAVLELRDIAEGTDLPQAAAARATLARLAHDDSRKVSLAAQDALAATAVQLSQSTADLGIAGASSAPVTQVQLKGGPPAHASTVLAPPAIRARIVGDTLHLRLSGDRPGPVDATVTVTGPAGDATVQATGWVALDPGLPAAAAVSLAGSLTEHPRDQACALAAAAWATHHAGDTTLARTLLDRAGATAADIADPLSHALVAALVNWTGARCGDARRATRVPGDLAAAVRIVCTDPRDRTIALAALAWPAHAGSSDPAPPHGPSWWPMVHGALRWLAGGLGSAGRSAPLLDEAHRNFEAIHKPGDLPLASLVVDLAGVRTGRSMSGLELFDDLFEVINRYDKDPWSRTMQHLGLAWLAAVLAGGPARRPRPLDREALAGFLTRLTGADLTDHAGLRLQGLRALDHAEAAAELEPEWRPFVHAAAAWLAVCLGDRQRLDTVAAAAEAAVNDDESDLEPIAWAATAWAMRASGDDGAADAMLTWAAEAAEQLDTWDRFATLLIAAVATRRADGEAVARSNAAVVAATDAFAGPAQRSVGRIAPAWLLVRSGENRRALAMLADVEQPSPQSRTRA
ncbi:hypothetical protein AB0J72_27425 [Dactylosporangium sp. NPDC049742]|uniref:hypothetical protein n=1 Tax=Dactylosporangium sp. NPDC049742 TaxID=3154737 RepID=UPI00344A6F91